jgi:NADH:ubiquinone oxidoreductase subunit 3 (subunit A)
MWVFTDRVTLAFENNLVPILGIIFLPLTTFAYVLIWDPIEGSVSSLGWLAVIVALLFDLAINAGTIYGNRQRVLTRN